MEHESGHLVFARSVLVAVDFSRQSEAALVFSAQLCNWTGCRLTILHVVHEQGNEPGFYKRSSQFDQMLPLNDIALRMMKDFLADVRERHPEFECLQEAEILTVAGLPETRILEIAETVAADLLVIGSNGRSILSKLLKGSVSEQIMRKSRIPVHLVHMGQEQRVAPPGVGLPQETTDSSLSGLR